MGQQMFDQYSILHFAVGIIAYFWHVDFILWMVLHTVFEIVENTKGGMNFINKYFTMWPGGKPKADILINNIGDTISAALGWLIARWLDAVGKKKGWYK